jgi:hypothetical protein
LGKIDTGCTKIKRLIALKTLIPLHTGGVYGRTLKAGGFQVIPVELDLNPEGTCNLVLTGVSPVRVHPGRTTPFRTNEYEFTFHRGTISTTPAHTISNNDKLYKPSLCL